jgi:serine protease Do
MAADETFGESRTRWRPEGEGSARSRFGAPRRPPAGIVRIMLSLALLTLLGAEPAASEVFERYADRVFQVCLVSPGASSREACGSGFFVSADGLFITNYHVVASLVWHPEDFQVELRVKGGASRSARVLDVDAANDLALLRVDGAVAAHFELTAVAPERGAKLFSLGNPANMGLSIIEGTFNGEAENMLAELYHFSGSLNGGVSGGPALDGEGRVVGVNVLSWGNQRSCLVPIRFVIALLEQARPVETAGASLVARVEETLFQYQERLTRLLLEGRRASTRLGSWTVPGHWAEKLPEWGGPVEKDDPDRRFEQTYYMLRDESGRFLKDGERTGWITLRHTLTTPKDIGSVALYRVASKTCGLKSTRAVGNAEEFHTRWRCEERLVSGTGSRLRAQLCLRSYTKLNRLYDLVVRTMTFDSNDATVVSDFEIYGFSVANAKALATHFVEGISWTPSSSK